MITVPNRPFATEPISGLMLPDGIFEASMGKQQLHAHFRNNGASPVGASIYVESVSAPNFQLTARTYAIPGLPGGASRVLSWDVDVSQVPPGEYLVSFIVDAGSGRTRIIKKFFVTRVSFNPATKTFSAQTPEGLLQVRFIDLMAPKDGRCCGKRPESRPGQKTDENFLSQIRTFFRDHTPEFELCPAGYLLHDFEMVLTPTPSFAGQYGDLPFQDPWWKIVLAIIAALLVIASAIAEAVGGGGGDGPSVTVSGTTSGDCCQVGAQGGGSSYVAAGLLAAAAAVATAAALSDARDPFRRGQDHTAPAAGEVTTGERVTVSLRYPEPVALGKPFAVGARWEYTRITTGASYSYTVDETNTNVHVSTYKIQAPNIVRVYREEPFIIQAEFFGPEGQSFRGDQLFVQCILAGPNGEYRRFLMQDDGIYPDQKPKDGVYTGIHEFTLYDHGFWKIYVIAQDVNSAQPDMTPDAAAKIIGGMVLTHQLTISFSGGTCPLVPDGDVHVISPLGA